MMANELVSIIIPTYRRPVAVKAAVDSALQQSWPEIEIIVVSDGPDEATRAVFADVDPRVRYMELETNQGPAAARNAGVAGSHGEWLAFLDDDDLMLPEKVERQMRCANKHQPEKMISCRLIYQVGERQDMWPAKPIGPGEDLSEYLLLRKSLLERPGVLSLQALLMHRSLPLAVPFSSHEEHEDWAWLLEVWHRRGARVEFVWEPLVIYSIEAESESRSRRLNWRASMDWAQRHRYWITDRAYCSFLATKAALKAKRAGDWRGLVELGKEIVGSKPGLLELCFFAGVVAAPIALLHRAWKSSLHSRSGNGQTDAMPV